MIPLLFGTDDHGLPNTILDFLHPFLIVKSAIVQSPMDSGTFGGPSGLLPNH